MIKRISFIMTIVVTGLLLLLLPALSDSGLTSENKMKAQRGKLDSAGWNLEQTPVLSLDGEWEFYWNRLLIPADFHSTDSLQPDGYMLVPSLWNGKMINGNPLPVFGCATYRLILENVPFKGILGLNKKNARFSSKIYVNGQELMSDGIPAQQAADYKSGNTPELRFFDNAGDRIEIIVQVANYEYINSGIPAPLEIGTERDLLHQHQKSYLLALFVFGVLWTIAFLYLIFFVIARNRGVTEYLMPLFSLFCFLFAIGNGLTDQRPLLIFLPNIPFTLVFKLKDFFLSANFIVVIWIFNRVENGLLPLRLSKIISYAYGSYLAAVMILPIHVYYKIHQIVMACNTVILIVFLMRVILLYIQKAEGLLLSIAIFSVNLYSADSILFSLGLKKSSGFSQVYIMFFAIVMILLLSMQYFTAINRMKTSVMRTQEVEIAFLRAQIKPHFLYNSLSVIAALMTQQPQKAKNLLYDLTDYLRGSFHFENDDGMISLSGEMKTIKAYVSIVQARFKNLLEMEYDMEEGPDIMVPLLSIQPLVENAVRHGVLKRAEGGKVVLRMHREDKFVIFRVEDNGVGMQEETLVKILRGNYTSDGVGLKNIQKRLELYDGARLTIESREGVGTIAALKIPYREAENESDFSR